MPNRNIADISVFAGLQNRANAEMGYQSVMSVFNATFAITDAKTYASWMESDFNKRVIEKYKKQVVDGEKELTQAKNKYDAMDKDVSEGKRKPNDANYALQQNMVNACETNLRHHCNQ